MPDIDGKKEDRTSSSQVKTYVPGFSGYSSREDVRDADRMLRMQISQKLTVARRDLEEAGSSLQSAEPGADLSLIVAALNSMKRISADIGYSETSHSFSIDSEISEEDIGRLVESDAEILNQAAYLLRSSSELNSAAATRDVAAVQKNTSDILSLLSVFEELINRRTLLLNRAGR